MDRIMKTNGGIKETQQWGCRKAETTGLKIGVKCLPYKHRELSLDLQKLCKNCWEQETGSRGHVVLSLHRHPFTNC